MRKTFLLKPLLLLCALIVGGTSSVWAEDVSGTINFGSAAGSTQIKGKTGDASPYTDSGTDSKGNTWTITTVTSNAKSFTQNAAYSQVGASSKPVTSITFTTTLPSSYTIKSFSAKFGGFSGTAGTVTLKVGETTVATGSLNASNDVVVNSTSTANGNVLTVTVTDIAKGVKCYSVSYTYSTGDDPEYEETFSYTEHKGQTVPDYGANITLSKTDVDITNTWYYCALTDTYATFYGTNGSGTITITPKNGATIKKVVFTTPFTSYNGYQSDGTITASEGTLSTNFIDKPSATETTWEGSATEAFTLTYHKTIRWTSIVVTYTGGTPRCATPEISGETSFITSSTVTISCATEGATIQYCTSTDGVNYTAYQLYTIPFQVSQSTTVKAQATKEGMVPSDEAYKAFVQHDVIPNIRYFISSHATTPFADPEYVQLENALVTYKNGNTAYLKDEYGAIMLFNCAGDLEAGDKLNGYMYVTGYNPSYNGLPEITAFELVEGYTKTTGNTVTPTVMTLSQLMDDPESSPYEMYLSQYVKIENATVISAFNNKNCTIEQGGKTIILRDNSGTMTSEVYDEVTVTGFVSIFNTTKQITVYEQSQIVNTEKVKVTIPESKLTTFVSTKAIDFSKSGITAYTAKVDGSSVKMTAIPGNIVPANTGVVLSAETAGKFTGDVTTGGSITGENELVGVTEDTEVAYNVGTKYNYILQDGAFYKATGAKLKAGKAYLSTTYDVSATPGARLNIVIDGETTGINTVQGSGLKVNGEVYDLQGRRIQKPTKGLYIVDGKKVLVK